MEDSICLSLAVDRTEKIDYVLNMQCQYKWEKEIKAGNKIRHMVGEQCRSNIACTTMGDPMYGYCFRHAIEKGLVPDRKQKEFADSRSRGIIKFHKEKKKGTDWGKFSRDKKLTKAVLQNEEAEKEKINQEIKEKNEADELIHKILGDRDYDAQEMFNDLKGAGADFKYTDSHRKFVFIGWYTSDVATRKPGTLKELCKIIGISNVEGLDWIESDWFATDLKNTMIKHMRLAMPYLHRKNLTKAMTGDMNAFKEFNKVVTKHEIKEGEADWDDELSEEIKVEVNETLELN